MTTHYEPDAPVTVAAGETKTVLKLEAPSGTIIETENLLLLVVDPNGDRSLWKDGVKVGVVCDGALQGTTQRSQIGDYGKPHRARYTCRTIEFVVWNDASYAVQAHGHVEYETKLRQMFQPKKGGILGNIFRK